MIARLIAIQIAVGLLLLTGCATAPRVAPRFQTPSTAPLERAAAANRTHVEQARAIVREVKVSDDPVLKLQLDKVINLLDQALADNALLESALAQLLTQIGTQTKDANQLATRYDKKSAALTKASKKLWWYRLHWWGAWIAFALGVLACIGFAFLKFTGRLVITGAKLGL